MMKYLRLFAKTFALELSADMVYKFNFMIKCLSLIVGDTIGPIVVLLIYSNSAGIPGWSFEEFMLFQGTFILIMGIGHMFLFSLPYMVMEFVREGTFNNILVKPYNPLLYLTFTGIDLEGSAEILVGLVLIIWSAIKLNLVILSLNLLFYILLVIFGLVFIYSMMVLVASLSFIAVRSFALAEIFFRLTDLARYPLAIYGAGFRFVLTFLVPVAVISNYPATALLKGISLSGVLILALPIFGFLIITLVLWNIGMKKHSSAGG